MIGSPRRSALVRQTHPPGWAGVLAEITVKADTFENDTPPF